eukprot:comp12479_c0_seq1/m.7427 comp12479_c0_seq1/g.7427  ORF comp12479_c0_seq1/g.7427 comp12479_c0_seq1/m.7427 type:complete len:300 (-) comp12479_c0_seq1:266-1165(-)
MFSRAGAALARPGQTLLSRAYARPLLARAYAHGEAASAPAHSDLLVLRETLADGVVQLTLNKPKSRNALSLDMMEALQHELDLLASNDSVRCVIMAANGPAFCAGHDLKEMFKYGTKEHYEEVFTKCSRLMTSVLKLPQPVIAKVRGVATAAGIQLVATCDLAYAANDARFATPGVDIGLFCSTPAVALGRAVSRKHAMEMLLTGDMYSADQMVEWGLVNQAVDPAHLDEKVLKTAQQIASKSKYVVSTGKATFYKQMERGIEQAYEICGNRMVDHMVGQNSAIGIEAFLSKKKPTWVS